MSASNDGEASAAAGVSQARADHNYNSMLNALTEISDTIDIETSTETEVMETSSTKNTRPLSPSRSPNSTSPIAKKVRTRDESDNQAPTATNADILAAVQALIRRFDEQDVRLQSFEQRIGENTKVANENKVEINRLNADVYNLKKQNRELKEMCLEAARYKRRWDLRLNGLAEKDNENTRETVIGILTRVIPVSVDTLRMAVDTVHRLGRRDATTNNSTRPIIIQFALRTVRDQVWKSSRDARVCKEMKIQFKEDFSKEDREARAKLWPLVEAARRNQKKAYLREGYALIDGKRVDVDP